jgi:ABC-type Fe3+ transport system permease subunit
MPSLTRAPGRVIPGFGLSLGFTIFYLALIVLIPLSAVFLKTFTMTWEAFWTAVSSERVVASYKLSFGASLIAAGLNVIFGGIVAWVLVRYRFPGKRFIDALVDLPFALPTAVAGITLTALYSNNGWIGKYLEQFGIKVAFTHRPAFRGAHGAAGAGRSRARTGRSGGQPRRQPAADLLPRDPALDRAGPADRLRARLCARHR